MNFENDEIKIDNMRIDQVLYYFQGLKDLSLEAYDAGDIKF